MGLNHEVNKDSLENIQDVAAMKQKFHEVDSVLEQAFTDFTDIDTIFEVTRPKRDTLALSRRWLIMHPITHEFHHKGQLLALARVLGHPLPDDLDTDLVLP